MPKPFTHIIIRFPSKNMDLLYRASDGMSIGCRSQLNVVSGEERDPKTMATRAFLDEDFAYAHLRKLADIDESFGEPNAKFLGPREKLDRFASIEERFGESKVIHASGPVLGFKD